ncbi:Peptidase family M28 [Lachnospiraceae bacterium XBB2008]|nr:Peptidase family M28 [Lachnospiraceae bacterium XBB2008]
MQRNNELIRLLKLIENTPCYLPEKVEEGIFYDLKRVKLIDDEIRSSGSQYKRVSGKDYYRLYAQDSLENLSKEFSEILLVSSHADNLQKCSSYDDRTEYIKGCFDNAATNAVCVYLMKALELPRNVLFVFTADEEYHSEGAEHVARKLKNQFDNVNVIVLDVTYGFQNGVDFTIENDFIFRNAKGEKFIKQICNVAATSGYSWNFLKKTKSHEERYIQSERIKQYMEEGCKSFSEVKGPDETQKYKKKGFNTFSLCLPCSAENDLQMHDDSGFRISVQILQNYTDFLRLVLQGYNCG